MVKKVFMEGSLEIGKDQSDFFPNPGCGTCQGTTHVFELVKRRECALELWLVPVMRTTFPFDRLLYCISCSSLRVVMMMVSKERPGVDSAYR